MLKVGNMPQEKRALHALNRLAFGPRPGDLERVDQIGDDPYIREQLDPQSIPVPPDLARRVAALTTLQMTPVELFESFQLPVQQAKGDKDAQKQARQRSQVILQEAIEGRLMRAVYGPRQLQEVMTAFWFNHFNVFVGKGLCHLWTGPALTSRKQSGRIRWAACARCSARRPGIPRCSSISTTGRTVVPTVPAKEANSRVLTKTTRAR
jgi:uncharacterized protein (DUF1800 family)